jgi:L-asparaginase
MSDPRELDEAASRRHGDSQFAAPATIAQKVDQDRSEGALGSADVQLVNPDATADARVLMIYTGGTLGMAPNAEGSLEPSPGLLQKTLSGMPELSKPDMPRLYLTEMLPLIDSSDMGPGEYIRLVRLIEKFYLDVEGIVVLMGTDTMCYASSAVSFCLENLAKPVVFSGSMLPLYDTINDARRNLVASIFVAAHVEVPEVCIFFNDTLLRANRAVKWRAQQLSAFHSPNFRALATLGVGMRLRSQNFLPPPRGRLRVHTSLCTDVAVLRMVPGFGDEYISSIVDHTPSLRAIILELYGTGNLQSRQASLLHAIQRASDRGVVVIATTQCLHGFVSLDKYELGRRLSQVGVVSGLDMTTEAAAMKVMYVLGRGKHLTRDQIRTIMHTSLRGELTEAPTYVDATSPTNENKLPLRAKL